MKKRVVAILLSLTMCSSMVTEAGAAAMLDSAVESYSENSFSDSESDVTVEEEPMVDGSRPLDENDDLIMNLIRDRKAVVLLNKTDLKTVISEKELSEKTGLDVIAVSAREETGIDQLENKIKEMFYEGDLDFNDEVMITNVRHKTALSGALESLKMVKQSIENQMPEDFLTIDLMDAYEKLGAIIGEAVEDDLVNEIFSRFCTGK